MLESADINENSSAQADLAARSRARLTGVWLVVAAITMIFAALTSALIVSQGTAPDWQRIPLPSTFYWNIIMLLGSGILVEGARRRVRHQAHGATRWLAAGLLMATLFIVSQIAVLQRLHSEGFHIAAGLSCSYFFVMVATYSMCAFGGITALALAGLRLRNRPLSQLASLDAVSYYWYYLVALWCYLLALFWMRI